VAQADLDGDDKIDLVTANGLNGLRSDVSVLLGLGNGRFEAPVYFATGAAPVAVAVADFDRDSVPDLVTANHDNDTVSVLLGNGDGTFREPVSFASGNGPAFVAAADLDGDDVPDIVSANEFGGDVSVLLGNGDGSFQAPAAFAAGAGPVSIAVAQLDGGTFPDLVTANRDGDNLSVLLGNGDGTFQSPAVLSAGDAPVSVVAADLDGDDFVDLASANRDSNNISVWLSNGDGSFQAASFFQTGIAPVSIAVESFYGEIEIPDPNDPNDTITIPDEFPDLVSANRGSNDVGVLLGNGDGSFRPAYYLATGSAPVSIATGNVNGDTATIRSGAGGPTFVVPLLDIITANRDSYNVTVWLGRRPIAINPDPFRSTLSPIAVAGEVRSIRVSQFCNAVDKNGEGITDPAAHLTCFENRQRSAVRPQVVTTDQFGGLALDVSRQRTQICLPTQLKWIEDTETNEPAPLLDTYELYRVKETRGSDRFEKREVSVEDIFVDGTVPLKQTKYLGLPTDRSGSGVRNPFHHLNCYSLKPPKFKKVNVQVKNAFGEYDLTLQRPTVLCTPSQKEIVSEAP